MYQFCFNDCFPKDKTEYILTNSLDATLREYARVRDNFPDIVEGIITDKEPGSIILSQDNVTLGHCINRLTQPLRIIAYTNFNKHPIEQNLFVRDQDDLLQGGYFIRIDRVDHNAINAKIVSENGGILFTLALHDDLKRNSLTIIDNRANESSVINLYGEDPNTRFVNALLNQAILDQLEDFDKLVAILGNCRYGGRFKKGFEQVSKQIQESIIDHFESAIGRNGISRLFADGDLIKDVTPEKEKEIKLFELRIFKPVGFRIYFYESAQGVYLALAEPKPNQKVQDNHIKNSISIVKQLILLEN